MKPIKDYFITLLLLLFCAGIAYPQHKRAEISSQVSSVSAGCRESSVSVDFRVNSIVIDSAYSDNALRIRELLDFLRDISKDSTISILKVSLYGAASPEGSYQLNRKLANGRLGSLEKLICSEVDIPQGIISRNDSYIPWDWLKLQIEDSDFARKDEILAILDGESYLVDYHSARTHIDNRILKLKQLDNGRVWQQMHKLFFERMRNACAVIVTYKKDIPLTDIPTVTPHPVITKSAPAIYIARIDRDLPSYSKLYIKTNALGLALGIANLAAEIDLAKHWSITLPIYYSAWDYFKSTIKFRTFALQPEVRWWLSGQNNGLFAGAHLGLAFYNLALNGDYRYQDHNRETPSIGGGVSLGYRIPISKDNRWNIDFSLGAGVYSRYYDKFHNTPDVKDGLIVESINKTYWGIDQAAVSFSYMLDLKKKGGKR